jgi:helicase MOV-10
MVKSAPCPQLRSVGVCTDRSCKYKHEMHVCEVCNLVLDSANNLAGHRTSKHHQKRVAGQNMPYHCSVCQKNVPQAGWPAHLANARHCKAAAQQHLDAQITPELAEVRGSTWCSICSTHIPQKALSRHLSTRRHDSKRQFASYKVALEETEKDKHGITISTNGDFGIVDGAAARAGLTAALLVENSVPISRITIVDAKLESTAAASSSSR